jgi:hypothetical protein
MSLLVLFMLVVLFSSCRGKRVLTENGEPIRDRSAGYLLKHYEKSEFKYDWVGMRIDAEVRTLGESQSFKANVRMRKDSVVWLSISPALGIEVFKAKITPDSLMFISKIPDNRYYFMGKFEALSDIVKTDLDFEMLQELLIGNAMGLERDEGKFRTEIDDNKHLLISKYKRRVKKVVGVDDRKLSPTDTLVVNPNDKRYQRVVKKNEDELIISRYWLDPTHYKLARSLFNDLVHNRTMEINYSEFKVENDIIYPSKCIMNVRDLKQQQELEFQVNKIVINKPYETPFEVPDDMPRKEAP